MNGKGWRRLTRITETTNLKKFCWIKMRKPWRSYFNRVTTKMIVLRDYQAFAYAKHSLGWPYGDSKRWDLSPTSRPEGLVSYVLSAYVVKLKFYLIVAFVYTGDFCRGNSMQLFVAAKLHQVSNLFETPAISRRQIALKIEPGLHVRF